MKPLPKHIRLAAAGLIVVGVIADCWWLARRSPTNVQQFSVEPTDFGFLFSGRTEFPMFDVAQQKWFVQNGPISSIKSLVRTENGSPDGIGAYVIVSLRKPATVESARDTLSALIAEDICQVGIVDAESQEGDGMRQVLVSRIRWVLSADGHRMQCKSADHGHGGRSERHRPPQAH
jgi:hypothetical protein